MPIVAPPMMLARCSIDSSMTPTPPSTGFEYLGFLFSQLRASYLRHPGGFGVLSLCPRDYRVPSASLPLLSIAQRFPHVALIEVLRFLSLWIPFQRCNLPFVSGKMKIGRIIKEQ